MTRHHRRKTVTPDQPELLRVVLHESRWIFTRIDSGSQAIARR